MPQPRNSSSTPEPPTDARAEAPSKPAAKPRTRRAATTTKAGAASETTRTASKPAAAKGTAKATPPKSATAKSTAAKSTAAKSTAAKSTAAKSTTTKSSASSASRARATAAKSTAKSTGTPAAKAGGAGTTKTAASRSTAGKAGAAQRGGANVAGKSKPRIEIHVNAETKQLEAVAERLRKLNERIIELGREAGESRLTSYEKTLKTIANGISQGPRKDELEWITHLASSQAKFVREITDSWAKAARDRFR